MSGHVVSIKVYVAIFAALMLLTAITVAVAFVDVGVLNNIVALTIAVVKATLVILYFMHVRYSSKLTWLILGTGFAWLVLMIVFIMLDPLTRSWLSPTVGYIK
jgi:cytochrome c oxidase subunit 4